MGLVQLNGSLTAGSSCVSSCGGLDSGTLTLPLSAGGCGKQYAVATGLVGPRTINSPLAFTALTSIGTGGDVVRVEFLYLSVDSPLDIELTTDDGSGGDVVAVIPVDASTPFIMSFPTSKYLKLLRVRGNGRVTYFAAGPQ